MEYPDIEELQINQRFALAGSVYTVRKVDYDDDYQVYKVTARAPEADYNLELRVPEGTPFLTVH